MHTRKIFIDGEVLAAPHFSGIGHYTLNLLRALDEKISTQPDIKAYILIYYKDANKIASFKFKHIKIKRTLLPMRITNALKRFNLQPPLDLLFGKGTYIFPNFTSWPLLFSKNVSVIYDLSYEKFPQFADKYNQIFLSKQVRKTAKWADRIITISTNSKHEISDFYSVPMSKIEIIYPLVNERLYYRRSKEEVNIVRNKYDLPESYILFIGNLEPRKNILGLLTAYEKLPDDIKSKHPLVLVGSRGWKNDEIHDKITALRDNGCEVVRPDTYITDEDIPAIYSGASSFVFPSIYEGFGIPPVEALACGTSVVAANNSSLPEAVGDSAILVDALDVESIKNGILLSLKKDSSNQSQTHKLVDQASKYNSEKFKENINFLFF